MGIRSAFSPFGGGLKEPFKREEIIIRKNGDDKTSLFEIELPKGVYYLKIASSAANGFPYLDQIWYYWGGGSGAAWEGIFYNPQKQLCRLFVENGMNKGSYLELGDKKMLELGGASAGSFGYTGAGGILTVASDFKVVKADIARNGVQGAGGNGYTGVPSVKSPSTIRPWGDTEPAAPWWIVHSGGFELTYIGRK